MTKFKFYHGLGDCSNAAHLFALYTRRGFRIGVECVPDKSILFEAAGCDVVPHADDHHDWVHAPSAGPPQHADHWSGNKTAWNISVPPLPEIGGYWDLWDDLCAVKLGLDGFVSPSVIRMVDDYIRDFPRPLILFAPQGSTLTHQKNLSHEVQAHFLHALLEQTDGSVILLDWDQRVFKLPHWRIRHLGDDWKPLGLVELHALIRRSDLVIGCDSGVLHFTRFSDTPALGVWTGHHPSEFALPRANTMHVAPQACNELTRYRRVAFNIVEYPDNLPHGQFIAEQATRLLGERKYVDAPVPDTLLRHLVEKCRQCDSTMATLTDRHKTFDVLLSMMRRKKRPLVVETGCIRSEEDWSAGYFTYLFGYFLSHHGGRLHSVDNNPTNVAFARMWTAAFGRAVQVHEAESDLWLRAYSGPPIDFLYLDSADTGTPGYQECSLNEVELALPHLAPDAVIIFDDTYWSAGAFQGKGGLAVPWLIEHGWKIVAGGYQVLLRRE
jgi:predicted O-methyltransferase YrrM